MESQNAVREGGKIDVHALIIESAAQIYGDKPGDNWCTDGGNSRFIRHLALDCLAGG